MITLLSAHKKYIYIQGQRMELQAWTPIFNPNEDNPTVPVWIVILELPWHFYYKEIISVLLSPVGKVLHLDFASMQKIRGSVAKVKMQVDVTNEMTHHVWLGFDEDQDVNGDGLWLEVVYEDLPTYCLHCKHSGHEEYYYAIRKREEDEKRKTVEESTDKNDILSTNSLAPTTVTQHQQPQASQVHHKNQHSKQKIWVQHQSEQQVACLNHNKDQWHTKDKLSKDQWHTQKKKNFRGVNQRNKPQKFKISTEQVVVAQVSEPHQISGTKQKPHTSTQPALDTVQHPSSTSPITETEVNGETEAAQEIQTLHKSGNPKGVGSSHSLHRITVADSYLRKENISNIAACQKKLQ